MLSSYRLPLLGLVLAAAFGFAPSAPAADGGGIALHGRVSAYVDITIPSTVTLSESEIEIRSTGRFAGFYLLPDTSTRPPVGALYLPRVGAGTDGGRLVKLGDDWTVYPGGYRLYLLAERPTDVILPLDGVPSRAYFPRRPVDVRLHSLDFAAGPSDPGAERRIRLPLRGQRTLFAAAQLVTSTSLTGSDAIRTCVTRASLQCSDAATPSFRMPATAARSSSAGVQPAGTYDAVFSVARAVGLHGDTHVKASAITLALG